MHTKYLMVETTRAQLRSEVIGYSYEDTAAVDLAYLGGPAGPNPTGYHYYMYPTVLHALAAGWRLIGQPQACGETYTWWLTDDGKPVLQASRLRS